MKRLLALPLFASLALSCGKPQTTSNTSETSPGSAVAEGWKTYEDDWFVIHYPEGSDVGGAVDGKQNPKFPTLAVVPKTAGEGVFGAFTLQFDPQTRGMLLRDAIQSSINSKIKPRGTLVSPPREIKVSNGKCLSAMASAPFDRCPKDQGSCFSAYILTVCDDQAGRRYTADTMLSRGTNANAFSSKAQQEAAIYERILRSLEFKQS